MKDDDKVNLLKIRESSTTKLGDIVTEVTPPSGFGDKVRSNPLHPRIDYVGFITVPQNCQVENQNTMATNTLQLH
jgi:hypothetical protein